MARLAHGCAVTVALLVLAAPLASASPTITTVAGGGTQAPAYYDQPQIIDPLDVYLPSPQGIAWSGAADGLFYVLPGGSECIVEWMEPDTTSANRGLNIEGGTFNDCSPLSTGYAAGTAAKSVKLNSPCCVTSTELWDPNSSSTGPLVASSNSSQADAYDWPDNFGQTVIGQPETNCNATPPAPDDNVAPGVLHLCNMTSLARQYMSPYNIAIGEGTHGAEDGEIYWDNGTVFNIATQKNAGMAWDRSNNLVVSDGSSAIYRYTPSTSCPAAGSIQHWCPATLIAGQAGHAPAFSGDGGAATAADFASPSGMTVGFDGSLYVADTGNCRVRKLSDTSTSATVTTFAGAGCSNGPLGDGGPADQANLDHPVAVAMAPTGLLISDTGHDRVRLVDRTSITSAPSITATTTPTFAVESLDTPPHLKCQVDGGTAFDCTSPVTIPAITGDGTHTFSVWENGDSSTPPDPPDPTPAVATFTLDTTPPSGLALQAPAAGATGVAVSPSFTWSAAQDVNGVDHYELWIDGRKDRDVPTRACGGGTCSANPMSALAEASHTWQVKAVDAAGNVAASEIRQIGVGGPPTAAFTINPNPALAGRTVTFNASASSDESGIARYEWDLDGDGQFEVDGGSSPATSRTYAAPASVTITLRVTDGTGKTSTTSQTLKISQPASGATLFGISVNSGAQYTNDPKVKLLVKAPPSATSILVSNDGGFLAPAEFPVASSIDWTLDSSGPERLPKTVYARFMLGPIISETYTDDIILDQIPPVVQQATLAPAGASASGAVHAAALRKYVVKVKATDSNSGVGKVQVAANKRKPGKLLPYKATLKLLAATRPRFIRAQDRAGNFSPWKKLR